MVGGGGLVGEVLGCLVERGYHTTYERVCLCGFSLVFDCNITCLI